MLIIHSFSLTKSLNFLYLERLTKGNEMIDFFKYADLCVDLTKWAKEYADGNPVVSDKVYDDSYKDLKQFERANPNMIDKDSPTQSVTDSSTPGFQKVTHEIPMISIANSNSLKELRDFSIDRANKNCKEQTIEFKLDGLALSLKYDDGELQDAITRGNGVEGDRVYANALQIPHIPKNISSNHKMEVRGEVVWLKDDFDAHNKRMEALGEKTMVNPRNGAAGTMKSKDPKEVAERKLSFVAYSVVKGSEFDLHSEDMKWLKDQGFRTSEYYICPTDDKVISGAEYMEKKRHTLPYLIDGLVIKVNDKSQYKRLGGTAKTPHYCTALKFPPEEKVTRLLDIEHSYGRSGAVTPVAIVEEVELALTKVTRASLHNWDIADYLGVHIGCEVVIRKAGEIIPEIVNVKGIKDRSKDDYEKDMYNNVDLHQRQLDLHATYAGSNFDWYERPEKCAHCGSVLHHDTNRAGNTLTSWVCANPGCSVKQFKNIVKFVSKDAMNIYGVSESVVEKLLSKGHIKDIIGLYTVTRDQLLTLDSFGERSADKFLAAISTSRKNYMNQFLAGVGIPNLGKTASRLFSEHFGDLEAFHQAQKAELESIPGIGSELTDNIIDFRKNGGNRHLFRWFIDHDICTKAKPVKKSSDKLKGLTLIMTGKSDKIARGEFKDAVAENGGSISSGITGKVDIVLLGDNAGPVKLKKIDALQNKGHKIKTITDQEFLDMLK